ncbi:sulfotransferase domain-containing protein [Labrenzia sp. 011]|uniref:sulfotransferase domain-containing protein n=1 Tax=Labrenzia sp. 011 TaxID=2171494 RepID=UPI003265E91B
MLHPTQELEPPANPARFTRNIFDAMISFRDHIRNESHVFPMAFANEEMRDWDNKDLECFAADLIAPWYFNFYVSWQTCEEKLHVTYEEMKTDKISYFSKILKYADLDANKEAVEDLLARSRNESTRKNAAVSGRGSQICDEAKQKILGYASYYPDVDFSPIGL